LFDLVEEVLMQVLEIEFFDDPGDGGDMLEPAGLMFPLVEFVADDVFLFG
jgi:hypothetical protein